MQANLTQTEVEPGTGIEDNEEVGEADEDSWPDGGHQREVVCPENSAICRFPFVFLGDLKLKISRVFSCLIFRTFSAYTIFSKEFL
jgi:hypothetical protein